MTNDPVGNAEDTSDNAGAAALEIAADSSLPGRTVVEVAGEIDMLTASQLRQELLARVPSSEGELVADLTGVSFIGSVGLGILVETANAARENGAIFRVVSGERQVARALSLTGLDQVLHVCSSRSELPDLEG